MPTLLASVILRNVADLHASLASLYTKSRCGALGGQEEKKPTWVAPHGLNVRVSSMKGLKYG